MKNFKDDFINKIENNIQQFGHHITLVTDDTCPRFAYTIGVNKTLGVELVLAGGIFYMEDEIFKIINEIIDILKISGLNHTYYKTTLGTFKINSVHHSWSKLMMLGLYKLYENNNFPIFQIIPSNENFTLEIPDMSNEWKLSSQPVWQWLSKDWDYEVPKNSKVITNINALKGKVITEVMRWEINEWEAFAGAGPDVDEEDIRVVTLATMLGIDKSLGEILHLNVGKGLWRDSQKFIWNIWQ